MHNYDQLPNESNKAYRIRLYKNKEQYGLTNVQIGELCNKAFGVNFDESAHRKSVRSYLQGYEDAKTECQITNNPEDAALLNEIKEAKRDLEQSKVQFRDERNAWNEQNRIAARVNQKLDYLEEQLVQVGKEHFEVHPVVNADSDNDLLVVLSDLHIGQAFDSDFGKYDSDIAKQRLEDYLNEVITIKKRHASENVFVVLAGDLISNSIHKTIAITNRENVINQIKLAIDYICEFCYELTKHFNNVYMTDCAGNHSRIDKKEDALHDERLDKLISWTVAKTLSHIKNFKTVKNSNIDTGIACFDIRGKRYVAVHGDFDGLNKSSVANLVLMLGFLPYACIMGHRHFPAVTDESGIRLIQGGSLAGSGDDYTIEKRLNGKPSQTVCVCTDKGIECVYPIIFE